MLLLRFILIFGLVYYFLKLLFRWLAGSSSGRGERGWRRGTKKQEYKDLTDQKIEDAEYEELS